ncbi:MAG TPA: hypothetical protein VNI01_05790 [Elusimicrobiota bacterium]|nr:hypothetical protein [Elusimicrobiota bacterium]
MLALGKLVVFLGFSSIIGFVTYLVIHDTPIACFLRCDRASDACEVGRRTLLKTSSAALRLSRVRAAEVRVTRSAGGRPSSSVALWLRTDDGDYWVDSYVTADGAEDDRRRIAAFLGSPGEPRLDLERSHRFAYWAGCLGLAFDAALVGVLGRLLWRL